METIAFLGVLGLGYMANQLGSKGKPQEGFTDATATVAPGQDRTPPGQTTVPGFPRVPATYDVQYQLPTGKTIPAEPSPSSMKGRPVEYATRKDTFVPQLPSSLPSQGDDSFQPILQTRPDSWEDATQRDAFVSPLSGIRFKEGEFKHANMVPFYRGQLKQSLKDNVYNQTLDNYTGSGKAMYEKREQTPLFEPTKEPIGNPFGFESTTNFMESRVVESKNRTNERPMESIRVGPGLNEGFTHLPSGGFQQQSGEEYVIARMPRTNDMRVATNPKLSYKMPVVSGSHFVTTGGTAETVGEVRKYNPDRFYINQKGERNFVTVGADQKPTIRSAQVLKNTTRPETSKAYDGPAMQAEGKATYTVGSTRTPLVKQMGSWGIRNADLSANFNKNTDLGQNDYGKSGVEIRPNERYYTGQRVHATNLAADKYEVELPLQDGAKVTRQQELIQNPRSSGNFTALGNVAEKPTIYDPNDPLRTTIKETTIDNDWLGMAGTGEVQKLTVYDPNDPMRTTTKETTIDNDWVGQVGTDAVQKLTVYDPNDPMRTTTKETTIDNDWLGAVGTGDSQKLTVYDPNDPMRTTTKETTIDNDWLGMVGTDAVQKLTVYDPNDPLRTTIKETTIDNDWLGGVGTSDYQKLSVYDPNDPMRPTIKETTIDNEWLGMAAPSDLRKLTVHDPNDVMRTTIRETTEDSDWVGIAAPADSAQKLTIYDPDDIARVTGRNTLADWDRYRNMGRQDTPGKAETRIQDGVRLTQKAAISARSAYSGVAYAATARAEKDRTDAKAMRHYAQKETISRGRRPAGSSTKLFNGEEYVNLQYRKIVADSVNDREPGQDRVTSEPTTKDVIGMQRPRAVLKLDITATRNEPITVAALESNPYVIPLQKIASVGGQYSI